MDKTFDSISKSLLVAAGYTVTVAMSNILMLGEMDAQSLVWTFVGAAVMGLTLGVFADSMPATWSRHMLVWGSIIFFNIASVTIEGRFFAPDLVQGSMFVLILRQVVVAFVATWLITRLFAFNESFAPPLTLQRSWFSWVWRFLLSAFSYILFYYFFGAFNYLLVTGPYYESHASGLELPTPDVVLMAELIRAPMIVISMVPFLLTYRAPKKRLAFLSGLILFVVGGVVPLLMQVRALPLVLLAASAVEIFLQNYLAGVVTARLLGRSE